MVWILNHHEKTSQIPTLNHTNMTEDKKPQKETSTRKTIGKRPRKKQSGGADKVGNGRSGGGDKTGNGTVGGDKALNG